MAKAISAGILLHRFSGLGELMVFICHPGGPFWKNKDDGAWSIPKGLVEDGDADLEAVARREFLEEVGLAVEAPLEPLGQFKQPSGKIVHVWHGTQEVDERKAMSNVFEMEWPPKSGQMQSFPEIDRCQWFLVEKAREKILKGQVAILDELINRLQYRNPVGTPVDAKGQVNLF
jgi:predicted NUDIX family NTP pyrophosphohydrolase